MVNAKAATLRQRLRVERELIGTAHPFVALSYTIRKGGEIVTAQAPRENPLTHPFHPHRLTP